MDNEVKGGGNQIDYGARIYDPRTGRWLSTDPMQRRYPNESPYTYTSNNPLFYKDPDGKDKIVSVVVLTDKGSYTVLRQVDKSYIGFRTETYYSGLPQTQTLDREITYTLDFRSNTNGQERVRQETFDRVRESGASAIKDYTNFQGNRFSNWIKADEEQKNVQEFGFVITGGDVQSPWVLGLQKGKDRETLDLTLLLGIADLKNPNPEAKDLVDDILEKVSGMAKISSEAKALSVLSDVQDKQSKVVSTGVDVILSVKEQADKKRHNKKVNMYTVPGVINYSTSDSGQAAKTAQEYNQEHQDSKARVKRAGTSTISE